MRKLVIAALTIGVLLVMGALRVADFWSLRAETLKAAETRAANTALILSGYLTESFAAADASLRQLVIQGRRLGGAAAPASEWTATLAAARAGLTGVGALSVVDASGIIRHSTRADIVGQSRRDNPPFADAQSGDEDVMLIGAPFLSPVVPRGVLIPLARRLETADGRFDGLVVASFLPADPRGFFRGVDVGRGGRVWVFHPDGVILFNEPSTDDPIGQPARENTIFLAASQRGTPGTITAPAAPGGPTLITAFHPTSSPPIIVAVSLAQDEVLADWWRLARGSAIVFAVLTLLLGVTLVILFRQIDERTAVEAALTQTRAEEAARLRDANQRLAETLEREQRARREAEEAATLKDHFVMAVSHELRTPLTAIAGWARMLLDGQVSEDKRGTALQSIERNAQAQKRLIEDLLDVAGTMRGQLRLDIRDVAVADAVRAAVDAVAPAVTAKHIQLETRVDPGAGAVAADPERLQQMVWNLLSNAVKFTPAGGQVIVSVARAGDTVEIAVRDTGAGISADFLPHVFERFRQGPAARRGQGGLGLGLAIVRGLAELHGGSVSAHSDGDGCGATFVVRLPARAAASPSLVSANG